jgi:hypothetical protein
VSRCGRSIELLADWKAHPVGCKADHGWADGYSGPCTDDDWDIVVLLNEIDPMFNADREQRIRDSFAANAPEAYAAFLAWEEAPMHSRTDKPPGVTP